ncbi:MAG: PASTA domain-containing protein [Erysipelotrichia bacterium]|nr:PASTA domain-containing protein [Erysipelotrichia bacterium]
MTKKKSDSCLSILFKMTILMLILAIVLVGGVFFAYQKLNDFFNRGGTVIVPDFRGKHIVEVEKIKPMGLEIVRRDEKYDDRHLKDYVIAQFPDPGTVVKPGKQVLLSISLGLQKVNVPDMVGNSLREVDLNLLNSQLVVGDRAYVFSDSVPPDRIVSQSPLPSEEYGVNKEVDLLISLGRRPEASRLPDLSGVTLDDAKNRLKAWGFNFGRIFSKPDSGRAKFQVISTNPAPYSSVRKGDVVSLLVSSGSDEGTATAEDLKRFEIYSGAAPVGRPVQPAPAILVNVPEKPVVSAPVVSLPVTANMPPVVVPQTQPTLVAPLSEKEMSFVMPDGFMPKEVKFIHITPEGRQQIYAGAHKPLDLVKVKVPVVPNSKVQIYINDVSIEERKVEP